MKKLMIAVLCMLSVCSLSACSTKPVEEDKPSGNVQIPNPRAIYTTIEDAEKAIGFEVMLIQELPEGYAQEEIVVIGGKLLEITYTNDEESMSYRFAQGSEDISGDYTVYNETNTVPILDMNVSVKGADSKIQTATWTANDLSFALHMKNGIDQAALSAMIESIQ